VTAAQESANAPPMTRICRTLSLGRATYYRWQQAGPEPDADVELRAQIQLIALEMSA
jgi:hypothetical protein